MFLTFALITLLGAAALTFQRNLVLAGLCLVLTFLGVAGLFLLLANPVAAALQIIVYSGAIVVLLLFVIMLLNSHQEEPPVRRHLPQRILAILPQARLACLNVLKLGRVTIDRTLDNAGNNKHVDRLVALRHWSSPLKIDDSRLTVHVLEAIDPASAILEFAAANHVDHIVIGARQTSLWRSLLGSVSAKVAAEAACSVTVVRPPRLAVNAEAASDEVTVVPSATTTVSNLHGEEIVIARTGNDNRLEP